MTRVVAITIPAGTMAKRCRYCGVPIWFAMHPRTGKMHPVACNGSILADARPPKRHHAGVGISHFTDCKPYLREQEVLRERREAERRILLEQQPELNL